MKTEQLATKILNEIDGNGPVPCRYLANRIGVPLAEFFAAVDYLHERKLITRFRGAGASICA